MNTITTTLTTQAVFSDDGSKRYLLSKSWDEKKQKLTIIMLAPSEASGIALDSTTQLVLNNVFRLGYGSVSVVNLFATLNDNGLKCAEDEDAENLNVILQEAKTAQCIVYAPGVGKSKNKGFQSRQKQVLEVLQPFEGKLHCLCDADGHARLQHPLSPAVRVWHLSPLKVGELLEAEKHQEVEPEQKKKGYSKLTKATPK